MMSSKLFLEECCKGHSLSHAVFIIICLAMRFGICEGYVRVRPTRTLLHRSRTTLQRPRAVLFIIPGFVVMRFGGLAASGAC